MSEVGLKDRVLVDRSWNPSAFHPFRKLFESYLRDGGVDPDVVFEEADLSIRFCFSADPGISIMLILYADTSDRVFYHIEAAVSRVGNENQQEVIRYLLERSRCYYEAYRGALTEDSAIVLLARGRCEGVTNEYFVSLLQNLIPFAQSEFTILSAKFGLANFYGQ